jgi:toxin ParE1/3/4
MRVEFSDYVEEDLDAIAEYIANDNPRRAVTFLEEIRAEIRNIGEGPLHYRLRPDIGEDARLAVVGRYVVLFAVRGSGVVRIERVVQGNMLLPLLFQ